MENNIQYQDKNYTILTNIILGTTNVYLAIDAFDKNLVYFRSASINGEKTNIFADKFLDNVPDVYIKSYQNKQKVLESAIRLLVKQLPLYYFINRKKIYDYFKELEQYVLKSEIQYYIIDNATLELPQGSLNALESFLSHLTDISYDNELDKILEVKNEIYYYHHEPIVNTAPPVNKEIKDDEVKVNPRKKKVGFAFPKINRYHIILFISIVVFIICALLVWNWFQERRQVDDIMDNIFDNVEIEEHVAGEEYNPPENDSDYYRFINMPMINVNFDELLRINKDTVGWIKVNNTNVNYPFVQAKDNEYYLNYAFDGSRNAAGWLFADYRSNWSNLGYNNIIYGHGRVDKVMFGSLENTLNSDWYKNEDNQVIRVSTPKQNTLWQIFSIYTIKAEQYYITTDFKSDYLYEQFLEEMKQRSIYDFNVPLNTKDKVLTLSTCKDTKGNRIVIQSKLIKVEKR